MMGKEMENLMLVTASASCASCKAAALPLGKPFCGRAHHSRGHLATVKLLDLHQNPW